MYIMYCNIGSMKYYNGIASDSISGGGAYNESHIGHEVNNFTEINGIYYGYVQTTNDTIDIYSHFSISKKSNIENANDILVVWVANKKIIGWYKDAKVFCKHQKIDTALRQYNDYNVSSCKAVLVPENKRLFPITGIGRSNVWYAEDECEKEVINKTLDYISEYENSVETASDEIINKATVNSLELTGYEKEAISKIRINQNKFREILECKYHKCCLCGVDCSDLLIASHIKPWSKSNKVEKLSEFNGLLLCPNHDKLFDLGLISFNNDGTIIISDKLSASNRVFMNVNAHMKIKVSDLMIDFLSYHREFIFKK